MKYESSVENQLEFIENCETKGSYDVPNGEAIRKADLDELNRRIALQTIKVSNLTSRKRTRNGVQCPPENW